MFSFRRFPVPRVQLKYSPSALADYRPRTNTPSAEDKITLSEARIMRTETTVDLPRRPEVPATTQAALLAFAQRSHISAEYELPTLLFE